MSEEIAFVNECCLEREIARRLMRERVRALEREMRAISRAKSLESAVNAAKRALVTDLDLEIASYNATGRRGLPGD